MHSLFLAAGFFFGCVSCGLYVTPSFWNSTDFTETAEDAWITWNELENDTTLPTTYTDFSETNEGYLSTLHGYEDEEFREYKIKTEDLGVDANGCNRKLKNHFEDRCDEAYEKVNEEAQLIEDKREKTKVACCALEDYEKCLLRAFDKANCVTGKEAIKENLKAARLFLTVIANITCSDSRVQCDYYANEASTGYVNYNDDKKYYLTETTEDKWSTWNELEYVSTPSSVETDEDHYDFYDLFQKSKIIMNGDVSADSTGCVKKLKKHFFEDRCDLQYYKGYEEAKLIKDKHENAEVLCCVLDELEKCSLRAFHKTNCMINAMRENLKATRLLIADIAGVKCSEFREECSFPVRKELTEHTNKVSTEHNTGVSNKNDTVVSNDNYVLFILGAFQVILVNLFFC